LCATVRYKLKLWEVRVNFRVHKSVSRIGLIRSDFYTTIIFGSIGWGFAPDPTGELTALPRPPSWKRGMRIVFTGGIGAPVTAVGRFEGDSLKLLTLDIAIDK